MTTEPSATARTESLTRAARQGPLFIVLNSGSGSRDAEETESVLSRVFSAAGRPHEFLEVRDPADIASVARRAVAQAVSRGGVAVAAGGDGTINAVAAEAVGRGCPFGVLPQGTFNYFGRVHGIPQDTEEAARALLGARVTPTQVGRVNGRLFLVNGSIGLYPQLLEDREASKRAHGRSRWVALWSGASTLLRSRHRMRLQVQADEEAPETLRAATLFVGNNRLQLDRIGLDAAHVEALAEGRLAAVSIRPAGLWAMLGLALRGALGRLGDADPVRSFAFRRLRVAPRGLRRIKVATDGEVVWMQPPLVFEVGAEPLLLLVPRPEDRAPVA
ncbi:MAG: diacylglycerol kinase family protein [Xylophilus ampelinus]